MNEEIVHLYWSDPFWGAPINKNDFINFFGEVFEGKMQNINEKFKFCDCEYCFADMFCECYDKLPFNPSLIPLKYSINDKE